MAYWTRFSTAVLLGSLAGCALPASDPVPAPETPSGTGRAADARHLPQGQQPAQAEELMEGRFSGVRVLRTADGGIAVQIRGVSTFMGSSEPLYVIDGFPVEAGPGGALSGINPRDIRRIEVLKDAGSTAMYGGRGANGVVLITTGRQ